MVNLMLEVAIEVSDRFPGIAVGGFVVKDLDRAAAAVGDITELSREAREALIAGGVTVQNAANDLRIAGWRNAIANCGLKPGTRRSRTRCGHQREAIHRSSWSVQPPRKSMLM